MGKRGRPKKRVDAKEIIQLIRQLRDAYLTKEKATKADLKTIRRELIEARTEILDLREGVNDEGSD